LERSGVTIGAVPQRQWGDGKFFFDASKPRWLQIAACSAQVLGLVGGLVFELVSMIEYPMLLSGWGYAITYLAPIAAGSVVMLFMTPRSWCPANMSAAVRLQFRLGIGMFASAWFVGAFAIANGYATSLVTQDAPMVYRRTSTPSDPKQISFYVGARVWPASRNVYEITVPQKLYATLDVPVITQWHVPAQQLYAMPDHGSLRLSVGKGRFGIDWLHGVVGAVPAQAQ
jgi:hypothetical protein